MIQVLFTHDYLGIALNASCVWYLRFGNEISDECIYYGQADITKHTLFECPQCNNLRRKVQEDVGVLAWLELKKKREYC